MSHGAHNPTSQAPGSDPRAQLEAYLDGMLEGEALTAFERSVAMDSTLKAEVEAQRAINASLGRLFHRAEAVSLPSGAGEDGTATIQPPQLKLAGDGALPGKGGARPAWLRRLTPLLAVAAVVAAAFAGLYFTGTISEWQAQNKGLINPADYYARKVNAGFVPEWKCENAEQFVKLTKQWWKEGFLIPDTDDVKVVGWSYYDPVLSRDNRFILVTVGEEKVIIVIDLKEEDRRITLPRSSKLHDFRTEVGKLVMHEITPLREARVLPLVERK